MFITQPGFQQFRTYSDRGALPRLQAFCVGRADHDSEVARKAAAHDCLCQWQVSNLQVEGRLN
jgi:hypothetical protein